MRIIGAILVAASSVLLGQFASRQLSNHVELLELSLSFWRGVAGELSFTRASPGWIFHSLLLRRPEFKRLGFVAATLQRKEQPFPQAFAEAIEEMGEQWQPQERQLHREAGMLLGSTFLHSQLEELGHVCTLLEERLEAAKDHRRRHVGLYRSLGMVGGAAVFILLI